MKIELSCRFSALNRFENGNGLLSPGAAIFTMFLPTVTLGCRPFGLGLACVYVVEIAVTGDSGPKPRKLKSH
jgi:hypothetical protein